MYDQHDIFAAFQFAFRNDKNNEKILKILNLQVLKLLLFFIIFSFNFDYPG